MGIWNHEVLDKLAVILSPQGEESANVLCSNHRIMLFQYSRQTLRSAQSDMDSCQSEPAGRRIYQRALFEARDHARSIIKTDSSPPAQRDTESCHSEPRSGEESANESCSK